MNRKNVSADETACLNGNEQSGRGDTSDVMERYADRVFRRVARPGFDYIVEEDLLRFVTKEGDVDIPLSDGAAETGKITRKAFIKGIMNRVNISAGGNQQSGRGDTSDEIEHAAYNAFKKIARPGFDYIVEDDLLRFMIKEDVDIVFPMFDGAAETGKITRKAFTEWTVNLEMRRRELRRELVHSINDRERAVKQLFNPIKAIGVVISVAIWLLMLDLATIEVLLTLSAALVALAVMFCIRFKNFKKKYL